MRPWTHQSDRPTVTASSSSDASRWPVRRWPAVTSRSGRCWWSDRGTVLFEDHNRVQDGDATQHPEFAIARWAAAHLSVEDRAACTVDTSGEHCPMCSGAHAWVGLGRLVYAASAEQLRSWREEWGVAAGPVAVLPVTTVAPGVLVAGPDPDLAEEMKALHAESLGIPDPGA